MIHIVEKPEGLEFKPCVHRSTRQRYAIMNAAGSVETIHGTMTFREGDYLIEGADGETLYVLTPAAFRLAYRC